MIYYWCELDFNEEGIIRQKNILHSCTEENLVEMLAYLTMRISWQCDTYEDALQRLEKSQNLTGNDCERVILRTAWNSELEQEEVVESAYFLKDRQLVRVDEKHITVTDIRYWHHQVWKRLCSGNWSYKSKHKKSVHQGRTHKQKGHWRWQSGIRGNLRNISEGKIRAKRASKYIGSVDYEPKFRTTENSWKEAKVRHQYEWHKKRHQDRMLKRKGLLTVKIIL